MGLAERVKELRKARQWTQADLARVSGLNPNYIAALETNRKPNPTRGTLDKLARAFGITLGELVGSEPPLPAPVANWRALGLAEDQVQRYARLWPGLDATDRAWLTGQLEFFARAEIKIRSLEAQADAQGRPASESDADPPVADDEPDPVAQYVGA